MGVVYTVDHLHIHTVGTSGTDCITSFYPQHGDTATTYSAEHDSSHQEYIQNLLLGGTCTLTLLRDTCTTEGTVLISQ